MDAWKQMVGERMGNIYILKRISRWAGYTTIINDYVHDLHMTACVCSEGSALFHIKPCQNTRYGADSLAFEKLLLFYYRRMNVESLCANKLVHNG